MVIRASVVQRTIKEKKEKLMAQARASLGVAVPTSDPGTSSREHGEPSVPVSKGKLKRRMTSSKSGIGSHDSPSRRFREDKQPNPLEGPRESSGDRVVPGGNISSRSSVLKTEAGEDSFQLYKACLLPMDQTTLASLAPSKLEETAAHDLMRVVAVTHQLTQQCMMWQKERTELLEKVVQLESEKNEIECKRRAEYDHQLNASERRISDLKTWSEHAAKALVKSNMAIKRLERECSESFNAGRVAGEREFLESEKFKAAIREARRSGAKDFKESSTFELILASEAAAYEVLGFMKCQSQISKLGGFKPGFDPGLLDSSKDGNLESPVIDNDSGAPEDPEFGFLADETAVELH